MNSIKLKPGDTVKLKQGLVVKKYYDGITLLDSMVKESMVFMYITKEGRYVMEGGYAYSREMLDLEEVTNDYELY